MDHNMAMLTQGCHKFAVVLVCMNSSGKVFQHSPTWLETRRSEQYFESSTAFHSGNVWTGVVFAVPLELFSFGYLWGVLHRSAVRFLYYCTSGMQQNGAEVKAGVLTPTQDLSFRLFELGSQKNYISHLSGWALEYWPDKTAIFLLDENLELGASCFRVHLGLLPPGHSLITSYWSQICAVKAKSCTTAEIILSLQRLTCIQVPPPQGRLPEAM